MTPKVAGVWAVGDGEFVVAEWVPDPEQIAQQLFAMADQFQDWTEPLTASREAFKYSTELHFETESDPYGRPWTPLAERTKRYKETHGYPEDILVREGTLKEAATSERAWIIGHHDILFDPAVLPDYGVYHQTGTLGESAGGPAHELLRKTRQQRIVNGKLVSEELTSEEARIDVTGSGPGTALPQRMFIGADEETILEVQEIFIQYINGLTDEYIGGGGIVRDPIPPLMGINKLGTFPIHSFTKRGQPILKTPQGPRFGRKL